MFYFVEVLPGVIGKAVAASCDGSPGMARESSVASIPHPRVGGAMKNSDSDDDLPGVFASDDDDDGDAPVIVRKPSLMAVAKRPREEADDQGSHSTVTAHTGLPMCKYGASCIRKNPQHFKEFKHPPSAKMPSTAEIDQGPSKGKKRSSSAAATAIGPQRLRDPRRASCPSHEGTRVYLYRQRWDARGL